MVRPRLSDSNKNAAVVNDFFLSAVDDPNSVADSESLADSRAVASYPARSRGPGLLVSLVHVRHRRRRRCTATVIS